MKLAIGEMWDIYDETDLFCITTNASLDAYGCLVMGGGIALEAKLRFPNLEKRLGGMMQNKGAYYGLLKDPLTKVCAFQVKGDVRLPARADLIDLSVRKLQNLLRESEYRRVDLNYPGIGLGALPKSTVQPLISKLPDTVTVWEYDLNR